MKKSITYLLGLLLLSGVATKSYGQAAGDYVFTQATDSLWATVGNWSISDGAGNLTAAPSTPTATTNVWIPAGKRMGTMGATSSGTGVINSGSTTVTLAAAPTSNIVGLAIRNKAVSGANFGFAPGTYVTAVNGTTVTISQPANSSGINIALEFYPSCKNLYVNGFMRVSAQLVAFGDVTVNSGGILTHGADFYCANINNYGTFNGNNNYGSSAKSLYFGYNGACPGTGDFTLINDGIFGDSQIRVPINGNTAGIRVIYSNQASNVTIKPSSSSITGYAFNIAQLIPTANIKTTANTNLYIKETMSLLLRNGIGFSIQQNDTCLGTTRTCTIDPGVTVYIGYRFHANGGVTTNPQGNFVYNVYGTLDLGTYCTASNSLSPTAANTTDFDLCLTTAAGNTGFLTFNLGDGTQANAGTLVLGSNVKLIKQKNQLLSINIKDYSTVNVTGNYGQAMNYQLLNENNPALYLFPKKYYNLTLNGAGVVLPVVAGIKGTKTYTTVNTTANWIAATSAAQGSILYTGSAYYYVPVVRGTSTYLTQNPITLVADTVLQYLRAGQTVAGNNIAATVSAISGNSITLSAAPTATATQTNVFVTFTGKSDVLTAPTGTSTDSYSPVIDGTQGLIYLGGADFATTSTVISPNAVINPNANTANVYSTERNVVSISNASIGDIVSIYAISGVKVASTKLSSTNASFGIASGIYLVKVNNYVTKVVVK